MNFFFHPHADDELDEAIRYYEECQLGLGLDLAEEVYSAIQRASEYPEAWSVMSKNTRRKIEKAVSLLPKPDLDKFRSWFNKFNADDNFILLKQNPGHPSLHLKKVKRFRSVRVGIHYRLVEVAPKR